MRGPSLAPGPIRGPGLGPKSTSKSPSSAMTASVFSSTQAFLALLDFSSSRFFSIWSRRSLNLASCSSLNLICSSRIEATISEISSFLAFFFLSEVSLLYSSTNFSIFSSVALIWALCARRAFLNSSVRASFLPFSCLPCITAALRALGCGQSSPLQSRGPWANAGTHSAAKSASNNPFFICFLLLGSEFLFKQRQVV